jgi:hypothetical protein
MHGARRIRHLRIDRPVPGDSRRDIVPPMPSLGETLAAIAVEEAHHTRGNIVAGGEAQ